MFRLGRCGSLSLAGERPHVPPEPYTGQAPEPGSLGSPGPGKEAGRIPLILEAEAVVVMKTILCFLYYFDCWLHLLQTVVKYT